MRQQVQPQDQVQQRAEKQTINQYNCCRNICHEIYHGGYDVIDHAFRNNFPADLSQELKSNGWLDDPSRGTTGRLCRARTKMDIDRDHILNSFITDAYLNEDSSHNTIHLAKGVRGDECAFISREERLCASFPINHPLLHQFITCIESMTNGPMILSGDASSHSLNYKVPQYVEFDKSMTSVQIARYPGDGLSGYPRHYDRAKTSHIDRTSAINSENTVQRILTFVYYLTPLDWDAVLDGGALRIYPTNENEDEAESFYTDVTPISDRMVVFRSDCTEHQVMPSLRRERIAITVWLYGRVTFLDTQKEMFDRTDAHSFALMKRSLDLKDLCPISKRKTADLPPPLPFDRTRYQDNDKEKNETIFVAIPSFRDSETWPTIQSLIQTAHLPSRVFVGVVWQVDTLSTEEIEQFTNGEDSLENIRSTLKGFGYEWDLDSHLREITMDFRHATGPCLARHLAQTLHRGEDYVLQIDSHMRFRPNWDRYLIQQLNKCILLKSSVSKTKRSDNALRAVLTAYPPNYNAPDGPGKYAETRGTVLVPWKFDKDGILRQRGRLLRYGYQHNSLHDSIQNDDIKDDRILNDNIPCLLFAGGFNFFHASLLDVCPYDHRLHRLFFGEEISMALRLYTHGYDLFSPPLTVCYHLWKRNPLRQEEERLIIQQQNTLDQRKASLEILRLQLRGLGRGLGEVRQVHQFSKDLGVDFERNIIIPGAENINLNPEAFADTTLDGIDGFGPADILNLASHPDVQSDEMKNVWKLISNFMGPTKP